MNNTIQKSLDYPGWVTPDFEPFDPIELAEKTEKLVCQETSRKYTNFYCVGVYGGISTGYTVGCPLRCVFCWVDWSRDFPYKYGSFYSPQEVFNNLVQNARKKRISRLRISGGEPTLTKNHLLSVLDRVKATRFEFILETNGILVGHDATYALALRKYPNIHVRVSLKAGSPEGFQKRTGALGRFYRLPYQAIEYLLKAKVSFHVAAMTDPRFMPEPEREAMLHHLREVGYKGYIEEEICDPYDTTLVRLQKAGFNIKYYRS